MKHLLLIFLALCCISNISWTQPQENGRFVLFGEAEVKPQFPGGDAGIRKYLSQNLRYPQKAKDARAQGMVLVQFIITAEGAIKDIVVAKAVHELLDAEAIRLVEIMPPWKPGEQNGKLVNVQYTLPIRFALK